MSPRVLVVDDEERMRTLLGLHLRRSFEVDEAASGRDALGALERRDYDLVILDILMPGMDGREVCRRIRERQDVPILMLTALTDVEEKLEAFAAGADDYLTKPFDARELAARADALVRRREGREKANAFGELRIDPRARRVLVGERQIALTPKEYDLLYFLSRSPGRAFSREELLQEVWGDAAASETRTVDSHVKTLREKLGRLGPGAWLATVWGVGYAFDPASLE